MYIYNLPKDIQPPWQVWFTLVYCEFRLKTNDLAGRQVWFDPGRLWQEVVVTLPNYPTPLTAYVTGGFIIRSTANRPAE